MKYENLPKEITEAMDNITKLSETGIIHLEVLDGYYIAGMFNESKTENKLTIIAAGRIKDAEGVGRIVPLLTMNTNSPKYFNETIKLLRKYMEEKPDPDDFDSDYVMTLGQLYNKMFDDNGESLSKEKLKEEIIKCAKDLIDKLT